MSGEAILLIAEAFTLYLLVLWAYSLRHRFGIAPFYALLGGITAVMSWVTDAGLKVQVAEITFVVGSTVFYTSLLLGVFAIYVFDGPQATRIAITTVAGVSTLVPLTAALLHLQGDLIGAGAIGQVPVPSIRINSASVVATLLDLIFLGVAWEFLGKTAWGLKLGLRTFLTLLGVMWLDVFLFATGAFAGTPDYLSIMKGTLISRFFVSLIAYPFLYGFLYWESEKKKTPIENRPVLAILKKVAEMEGELSRAKKKLEEKQKVEESLRHLSLTDDLTGLYNRRGFFAVAEHLEKTVRRRQEVMHLLYIDLDDLKVINDAFGHREGDRSLIALADILRHTFRNEDLLARLSGDEFAVILAGLNEEQVQKGIDRLTKNVRAYNDSSASPVRISFSIGRACYGPPYPLDLERLLALADEEMYRNKRAKKGEG